MAHKHLTRFHLKTIINILHPKMLWGFFIKEQLFLKRFKKLLQEAGWVELNIEPGGFAANGSFLYFLLKIYLELHPQKILELGSGQTSKLAYRYIREDDSSIAITFEDSLEWFNKMKDDFSNSRFVYLHCPLKEQFFGDRKCQWYDVSKENFSLLSKINLLIIDGPFGTKGFSRVGIVNLLPDILDANNFIIIVDDAHRKGETDTVKLLETILRKNNIKYDRMDVYGAKKQTFLLSQNNYCLFLDKKQG